MTGASRKPRQRNLAGIIGHVPPERAVSFAGIRKAHRPHKHRAVIDTSLARLIERANRISPAVAAVLTAQFNRRRHPEEALRSAQGILRLAEDFSPAQLAAACERALKLNACTYKNVRVLIALPTTDSGSPCQLPLLHENVRGPDYFQ